MAISRLVAFLRLGGARDPLLILVGEGDAGIVPKSIGGGQILDKLIDQSSN
jgi:hypothetical protein